VEVVTRVWKYRRRNPGSAPPRTERWGVGEHEKLLGCVAYLLPEKGRSFVARALPAVREGSQERGSCWAGDGPCRAEAGSSGARAGAARSVIFAGFVEEVPQVVRGPRVFVFPSLAEPLGTSLLAAMAWGTPGAGGGKARRAEYVEDGNNVYLVRRPMRTCSRPGCCGC